LNLVDASIATLQGAMVEGRATSRTLVEGYLARIEAYNATGPSLNAVTRLSPDALDDADALDRERAERGSRGSLHGIPFLAKDNMDVAGMPTTAGSRALDGLVAEEDAFVIRKLRAAGAVLLGKTNLHELAAGITTVGSAAGRTRNPYDPTRNPGGSSGGTAAAVAASLAAFGTGSDTCGSIRIPAAQNSLVGLRVTQGLTSRSGVVPLCLTQDVVGPIARTIDDLAIVLDVMVGADGADSGTNVAEGYTPEFFAGLADASLRGRRIGRLDTLFGDEPEDTEVASRVREMLGQIESLGAEIIPVELSDLPPLLDVGFTIILGDLPGDLADYLERRATAPIKSLDELVATGLVHPEVAPVLEASAMNTIRETSAYRDAVLNRQRLRNLLEETMRTHRLDALAYPTILRVAAPLGEEQLGTNAHGSANSGLPAISLPAGFDRDGHPVGLELLGMALSDGNLVALAAGIERALSRRRPPASTPELGPVVLRT
jgi:Asp-tRNA(Asn)/Glu-tRNA(Gln) amidotransferase A subunit family amidase